MTGEDSQTGFPRLEFLYTLTPEEVERLALPVPNGKPKWRSWGAMLFAVAIISLFGVFTVLAWNNPLGVICAIVLYSWIFQLLWAFAAGITARRKTAPPGGPRVRVTIDGDGVVEERPERTIVLSWRQVEDVRIVHDLLRFGRRGRPPIAVPLRGLPGGTDPQDLLQALAQAKSRWNGPEQPPGMASLTGPKISYTSSADDVARLYRHYLRHAGRAAVRQQWIALFLYFLGSMLVSFHFLESLGDIDRVPFWLAAGVALTLATSPIPAARKAAVNTLKQVPGMLGPMTVALSPEKIEIIHNGGRSLTSWSAVQGVEQDKHAIYIRFFDNGIVLIPRSAFASQRESAPFHEAAMRCWTARETGAPVSEEENSVWPPAPRQT